MNKDAKKVIIIIVVFILLIKVLPYTVNKINMLIEANDKTMRILSSEDNKNYEKIVEDYAKKNKINVKFTRMGDIDIVDELNNNSEDYDAVWISNSIWLYMLNNSSLTSNSKSISISPIVMGIKKNTANSLGLVNKDIYNKDLLELIKSKKIKYVMSSVTKTNTGATAYLGFLNSLAGSPEVLTEEMLNNKKLITNMKNFFSGVQRVSGDEDFLEDMFINSNEYEAVIASESSLISINNKLKEKNKEELYMIYPVDGVPMNDSTLAFINNNEKREENFLKIQKYLLSKDGQEKLQKQGQRTWYGGVKENVDKTVFNPEWGIDTTKYLSATKYPSKTVITKAINLYIEELRKPTHVVFCLDYSGSMYGDGINELIDSMEYILDYEKASKDKLQFSKTDKITVIPFSSKVLDTWNSADGRNTNDLITKINSQDATGGTALYDAIVEAMKILEKENDSYTKTIIAMTDGEVNIGNISSVEYKYKKLKNKIPVYSIMFGDADEEQLEKIAEITNAKVFDGKNNLLEAFKSVREYN